MNFQQLCVASRRQLLATALALAAGVMAGCGGGGGGSGPAPPPAGGGRENALTASRPGELLAYVKGKLRARQALSLSEFERASLGAGAPTLLVASSAAGGSVVHSGTTVQEAGVDEGDLIKTDGSLIYTLDASQRDALGQPSTHLWAHRRLSGGGIEPAASLPLPSPPQAWPVLRGMLLAEAARRIAVLSESLTLLHGLDPCAAVAGCGGITILPAPSVNTSLVQVQLVAAPLSGALVAAERITLSGRLVGARLLGQALYVVSSHAPQLAVEALPAGAGNAEREAAIAALGNADVLPVISINGGTAQPLHTDTDCYVQAKNASLGITLTSITVFDLASPTLAYRSRCLAGGSEALYMSANSLVLATTRWPHSSASGRYPPHFSTDLHKFALEAAGPVYRGSGSVTGHLGWDAQRKPYRISEHNGDLRVLSFTGELGWANVADAASLPPSPATLTVLRDNPADQTLQVLATLPNAQRPAPLGHAGEQVHGVRMLGERGYVVTFRQSDPLYVLDLSNPADPRAVGELQMPGFSDDLYPLPDGLLFGVGRQADATGFTAGVKLALFDVRDPARPRELATRTFGERGSISALDASPHGMNVFSQGGMARIALPLSLTLAGGAPGQHGLLRIEVDTVQRTLTTKPLLPPPQLGLGVDLWSERSVQIGGQVYYLAQGQLSVWDW